MSTDTKRLQLNGDDLTRARWLLGTLLGLLSAWSAAFIEIDAWALLAAITLVAVANTWRPAWPLHVPAWVHRLAFPACLAYFAYDLFLAGEPLPALIRLDLLLILYRMSTHRGRREDLQLIVLGLFLVVVTGVMTVSVAFVGQILAFAACALVLLLVLTLSEGHLPTGVGASPAAPPWTRNSWWHLLSRVRQAADWRLVVLGGALFAGLIVVSGMLFLAIPRFEIGSGMFLDRWMNRKTLTGFSDEVRFGEVTAISQDDSLALVIDADPAALPAVPYWRMVVLDQYTKEGFSVSAASRQVLAQTNTLRVDRDRTRSTSAGDEWTFYLEAGISRYLPLLGPYARLEFTEPQRLGVDRRAQVFALARDPPKMLAYRVRGMDTAARLADPAFARERRQRPDTSQAVLELPAGRADRERLAELRQQIEATAPERDAVTFADSATRWLERRHRYSLNSTLPPGEGDPLVRWLESGTPGHCEFFAGSLVLLARAAGYPARLVTGFKGGTWNGYSGSFSVRNANAHAWCEIFDDTAGQWVRVDPTPGAEEAVRLAAAAGAAGPFAAAFDRDWRARWESLRVFWYRRIVNFDRETQLELVTSTKDLVKDAATRLRAWLSERAEAFADWLNRPWDLHRFGWIVLVALGAVGLYLTWRRFGASWWTIVRWRLHPRTEEPVRREAGRWLRKLAKSPGASAGEGVPADLHAALLRLRYGPPASRADAITTFRQARRTLRRKGLSAPS